MISTTAVKFSTGSAAIAVPSGFPPTRYVRTTASQRWGKKQNVCMTIVWPPLRYNDYRAGTWYCWRHKWQVYNGMVLETTSSNIPMHWLQAWVRDGNLGCHWRHPNRLRDVGRVGSGIQAFFTHSWQQKTPREMRCANRMEIWWNMCNRGKNRLETLWQLSTFAPSRTLNLHLLQPYQALIVFWAHLNPSSWSRLRLSL